MPTTSPPQHELTTPSPLLDPTGRLVQVGWARAPLLDCNLEQVRFYPRLFRFLQRFRIKRWDYYGVTTPERFFSATLADLGYAGQAFVYTVDFTTGAYHEETITLPLGRGIVLPRNSTAGDSYFSDGKTALRFEVREDERRLSVTWPRFGGQPLSAEIVLATPPAHQSTVVVIPIGRRRFYYNRKMNCLPARGWLQIGSERSELSPDTCLGNLDWGRGVWEYRSFWVWASASGFLPDGRTVGLNLGFGFGDTSAATENTLILNGRIHKLGQVDFSYDPADFRRAWRMTAPDGRLDVEFVPFVERVARTNLLVITSEVHQLFGRYRGRVVADDGEVIPLMGLIGFAEEHRARW
ncbi:MAG: DUF2804 domain-containing protein [Caldilineales bacterium]|nr:DUF2804 domain-containing protein [Caldilineales bacterium]MDW8317732.1 DUF2804 domain-containing protein [Anaerolineae bacterium]